LKHLAIIILAAGASSRMGTPKQLLPFQDSTILGRVINNAKNTDIDNIFCVVGANAFIITKAHEKTGIQFIENPEYKNGLSTSIFQALDAILKKIPQLNAAFIILGDQPLIDASMLQKYLELHQQFPEHIIATSYGNHDGVPALFPSTTFTKLKELKGDQGAKEFINTTLEKKQITLPKDAIIDIDTQKEYENLLKQNGL